MRKVSQALALAAVTLIVTSPLIANVYYCATPVPDRSPSGCSYLCEFYGEWCGWTCHNLFIKCDDDNFNQLCLQSQYTGPSIPTCEKVSTLCHSEYKILLNCWPAEEVYPQFIEGLDVEQQNSLDFLAKMQCQPLHTYYDKTVGGSTTNVNCSGIEPGVF